jgi:hypothetical protein
MDNDEAVSYAQGEFRRLAALRADSGIWEEGSCSG